jgi:hypothetical protein
LEAQVFAIGLAARADHIAASMKVSSKMQMGDSSSAAQMIGELCPTGEDGARQIAGRNLCWQLYQDKNLTRFFT